MEYGNLKMMNLECRRLPATEDTLKFISPFFALEHIRKAIDDRWRTCYGIYDLFIGIRLGKIRVYGVFDMATPMRFMGFELGWLDETGEAFEHHAFWDRKVPAVECVTLCKNYMKEEFAKEGVTVKYAVGYIPDINRAAKRMALRAGCKDCGIRNDRVFYKNEYILPCREFRIEL